MDPVLIELDSNLQGGWHCKHCFNALRSTINSLSHEARNYCLRIREQKCKQMSDEHLDVLRGLLCEHVEQFRKIAPTEEYTLFAIKSLALVKREQLSR